MPVRKPGRFPPTVCGLSAFCDTPRGSKPLCIWVHRGGSWSSPEVSRLALPPLLPNVPGWGGTSRTDSRLSPFCDTPGAPKRPARKDAPGGAFGTLSRLWGGGRNWIISCLSPRAEGCRLCAVAGAGMGVSVRRASWGPRMGPIPGLCGRAWNVRGGFPPLSAGRGGKRPGSWAGPGGGIATCPRRGQGRGPKTRFAFRSLWPGLSGATLPQGSPGKAQNTQLRNLSCAI